MAARLNLILTTNEHIYYDSLTSMIIELMNVSTIPLVTFYNFLAYILQT